jgi:flagellar hook-length control protein FliK
MMDILNLPAGLTTASGTPQNPSASGALPLDNVDPASPQAGFGDALLNVISSLLVEQGQTLPRPNVSAAMTNLEDKDDEKEALRSTPLPLRDDAPQQLLEALLMSSQMPVRSVQEPMAAMGSAGPAIALSSALPTLSGPTLATQMPSTPTAPMSIAQNSESAIPLPKEMQPVAPQLLTTLAAASAAPAAVNTVSPLASQSSPTVSPTTVMQHAPVTVDTDDNRWTQQLQSALGERLQIQVKNQIQHATIRLDPPEMGKIDISLQVDNGRVQVQINASHAEVYRALQQTSNDLRQSLTEQNFIQVNVQVSSQSGQQQGKGHSFSEPQPAAILAGSDVPERKLDAGRHDGDPILLTV